MDNGGNSISQRTTSLTYPKYYEGPRPPVPGQEDLRRALSHLKLDCERRDAMNSGDKASYQTDCSGNYDSADLGVSPDNALRWARSLGELLRDEEGVQLLSHHLDAQRSSNKPLMFWLACQGLKRTAFSPDDRDLLHRRVKAIYRTFLRTSGGAGNAQPLPVSPECRRSVRDRINACGANSVASSLAALDPAIFDEPLAQVEAHLERGVYPSFLRSDLYLERLGLRAVDAGAGAYGAIAGAPPARRPLPPLPEEGEWEMPLPTGSAHLNPHTQGRARTQSSALGAPGGCGGGKEALLRDAAYFYSPSLPYHSLPALQSPKYHMAYATNVLPSAMDSERQSMSSEAFSEDPTTASGSEISAGRSSVSARQQPNERKMFLAKSQHHNYEGNTACSALSRCLAASGPAGPGGRKSLRHQNNKILKEHTTHNSTTNPGSGSNLHCDPLTFIPKMPQPTNTMPPSDPKMFVSVLTERLNAVLKEREKDQKLGDSIRRLHMQEGDVEGLEGGGVCSSKIGPMPPSLYPGSIMDDNSQSILDEHVSRVWKDSPPLQLPPASSLDPNSTSRHKMHHNLKSSPYRIRSPPDLGTGNLSVPSNRQHPLSKLSCPAAAAILNVTMATADHVHSTLEAAAASLSACSVPADQLTHHHVTTSLGVNMAPSNTQYHAGPLQAGKNNDKIYNWLSHTQKYVGTNTASGALQTKSSPLAQQQPPYNPAINSASNDGRNLPYPCAPGGKQVSPNIYLNVGATALPHAPHSQPQSHNMAAIRPSFAPTGGGHLKRSSSTSSGVSSLISCCAPPPPQGAFPHPLRTSSVGCGGLGRGGPTGYETSSSAFVSELEEDSIAPVPNLGPKQAGATTCGTGNSTVVGYYFCNEPVPYRTKLPCTNVTLGQFKALLRKKGNYRYYFKTVSDEFQTGVINEEISDDEQVLPLWEGKIFAKVELIEPDT